MRDGSLTVIEVAMSLGVSRSTIQRLIADDGLSVERHGRTDRISVDGLDAYIERCRVRPGDLTSAVRRELSHSDEAPPGIVLVERLIAAGWSESAICRALGLNPTAVAQWRTRGVPERWMPRIRDLLLRGNDA